MYINTYFFIIIKLLAMNMMDKKKERKFCIEEAQKEKKENCFAKYCNQEISNKF